MAEVVKNTAEYAGKIGVRSFGVHFFQDAWNAIEKESTAPTITTRASQLMASTLAVCAPLFLPYTSRVLENVDSFSSSDRLDLQAQTLGLAVLADISTNLTAYSFSDSLASFVLFRAGMNILMHTGLDVTRSLLEKVKGSPLSTDLFQYPNS